uniref:Uncharacterized protein n=1 Tax=Ascaris lumbricoides TaxID=6252 RepID=A0A9J2Q063_ASCLU
MPERDREILGAPKYSSLDDVPICKGNSRICNFISCTAHNFKNDQSFANINLATQVLADTKLRKAISKPEMSVKLTAREGFKKKFLDVRCDDIEAVFDNSECLHLI